MSEAEDIQIMAAARDGDLEGIGLLFERHHSELKRYFLHLSRDARLSEDLAQETFWRILRYRRSFDPGKPFRAWMFRIGRNVFYDEARKRAKEVRLAVGETGFEENGSREEANEPRKAVEHSERIELLREALRRLPSEKRELIVLCRFEELPQAEIAEIVGCGVGALKVRLYRALQELKIVFGEVSGEKAL